MESWRSSYLLLYRVSHFTHICVHSAVLSQTRLRSPRHVSDVGIRDWSWRPVLVEWSYPQVHLLLVRQLGMHLSTWQSGCVQAPHPVCFCEDVSKGECKMGHVGSFNKHRKGCCEWYVLNGKQLKSASAKYVMTMDELPPFPVKTLLSLMFLRKAFEFRLCV